MPENAVDFSLAIEPTETGFPSPFGGLAANDPTCLRHILLDIDTYTHKMYSTPVLSQLTHTESWPTGH